MTSHGRLPIRRLVLAFMAAALLLTALASSAIAASQNVALVPSAGRNEQNGGTALPKADFPNGYAPAFTDVSFVALQDGSGPNPLAGMDTVVLVTCNTADLMSNAVSKSRLDAFTSGGGKLIVSDAECEGTDYSQFFFPFATSNPGSAGASGGNIVDQEDNSLSSPNGGSPFYINGQAIADETDAIGDANVFTTFDQNWCSDLQATNTLGAVGPVQVYVHYGSGVIIYWGLDTDDIDAGSTYDPAATDGATHLSRLWLLQLLQPVNPDNLPCGAKIFGISLTPKTASNPVGTSHTVNAHVTNQGNPVANNVVTFTITAGPNAGKSGNGATDANGDAKFTYTGDKGAGTDTISASTVLTGQDEQQVTVTDTASKTWVAPAATPSTPTPADPKLAVAGVRRACVSRAFNVRISVNAAAGIRSVTVTLDGKRVIKTTKSKFTLKVNGRALKAGKHTLRTVAVDSRGRKVTSTRTIARCAAATPKRQAAQPRFTG